MQRSWLVLLALLALPAVAVAEAWVFDQPVAVTPVQGARIFHHLESSGRRNIAVSGATVAVVWEDDRDETPRVYLARKHTEASEFTDAVRVSGDGEAYEPSLVGLNEGHFVVAWEEASQVYARVVSPAGQGPVLRLSDKAGAQPGLTTAGTDVIAVWSERSHDLGRIRLARLNVSGEMRLGTRGSCFVDSAPVSAEQLYPSAAVVGGDIIVVWEDRRLGHTVIMAAVGTAERQCKFASPQRVSEEPGRAKAPYGKGHGVARATLATHGRDGLLAAWADKRDFRHGYDIYGSEYEHGAGFGPNARIQDDFGELARQWHTSAAGDTSGRLVVAWTDEREGNADVMLSWRVDGRWSDDMPADVASGPGEQSHPSIVFDAQGHLHMAWVERDSKSGPTRLRYARGRLPNN